MLLLARGNKGAFSERDRILPLFCSVGGEASARKGRPSQRMIEFSPSFAVWGGRLLLARGGNQGAFSRHQGQSMRKDQNTTINRVLCLRPSQRMIEFSPSFAVWGWRLLLARGGNQGAFSRHQGQSARKDQNTTINRVLCLSLFCFTFSGIISNLVKTIR